MEPTVFTFTMGQNLKRMRKKRGWPAKFVAAQLGLTEDTIYKYESGVRMVPADLVMQAACLLNCSLLDIYAGLDPRQPNTGTKELNVLSPDSSATMRWLATEWDGDAEALVAFMGTVALFPSEVRKDVYLDALEIRDDLLQADLILRDQLPPGTQYMEHMLGAMLDRRREGEY